MTGCGQSAFEEVIGSIEQDIRGGTLMGADGIGFAAKIDQVMSDGTRLICSGAFITPHVVLTAAHCTRNYDYGSAITPTTDTVIRYGSQFANSQKIAGDEKVGWRELGTTDIGLYRVAQEVALPTIPKLYRSCSTTDLVGQRVVVYGRMKEGNQAPTAEYYVSPERAVQGVANGVGANGDYLQIQSTTDPGDSGGPWVYAKDRLVAVTHTSTYGARVCDVANEIDTQVTTWGDSLLFVEDSGGGSGDGGGTPPLGQGGARDSGTPVTGSGGKRDSGDAGRAATADAGAGERAAGGATGASGSLGGAGTTASPGTAGGAGSARQSGVGGAGARNEGGAGAIGGNPATSAGQAGSSGAGRPESNPISSSGGAGNAGNAANTGTADAVPNAGTQGCSCRLRGSHRRDSGAEAVWLIGLLAMAAARQLRRGRRSGPGGP